MSETKPAAPEKRPRGRPPRPADQQTRLVAVRLTAAQIERAVALGSGDISAGIRRALLAAGAAPAIVRKSDMEAFWCRSCGGWHVAHVNRARRLVMERVRVA